MSFVNYLLSRKKIPANPLLLPSESGNQGHGDGKLDVDGATIYTDDDSTAAWLMPEKLNLFISLTGGGQAGVFVGDNF